MARSKNEKVIDGYLGDLPESIQSDVMEIHKLVIKTVNEILNTRDYSDLKNDKWAKEQLEEFCVMPADRSDVGSIRVYQKGKKYRCMIQLTGHFTNHMNDFNQELMHEFIKNVFVTVRPKIRKKYDFTITNEGDHGNPFEGFDVFPNPKLVEEIWNKLSDRKIRTVMEESTEDYFEDAEYDEFTEKSHGKLKYDFRYGFDLNTGHKVKVVYSLDNINVTMGGHGYDIDDSHDNNTVNKNIRSSKEVTSEIERNIRKKGDLDHASKGQKILAIVDRKTGEKLDKCRLIGIGTNNPIFGTTGAHSNVEINPKYLKDIQNDYKHIPEIHVGDVETESSFKTTHAFKEKDLIKHEEDWFGDTVYKDSINERLRGVETLKNGRGSKIDDAQPKYFGLGPTTYNHPSKKDIKKNPELYNKESLDNEFDDNDLFEEKSNGKLKYSFRVAINVENGHMIKIVFDLNPNSILQIGDHANRGGRDHVKDAMIKKNIQKNGFNDFSSQALVKAIVDMDTKQNLKSVKTIGVIGSNYNTTRFSVPEKYVDKKLGENASSFTAYPVATREKIAKELNLINAKDAITFTVGEYEKRPSYKATTATNSVTQVYNNQWKQGRGYVDSKKALFGSGLDNQLTRSNMHITTAVKMIEDRYNKIKSVAMKLPENDDIDDLCRSFESGLKRIKQTIENNKDENYGQTPSDSRYSKRIEALTDIISEIEDIIKNTNKNESAEFIEAKLEIPDVDEDFRFYKDHGDLFDRSFEEASKFIANEYRKYLSTQDVPEWWTRGGFIDFNFLCNDNCIWIVSARVSSLESEEYDECRKILQLDSFVNKYKSIVEERWPGCTIGVHIDEDYALYLTYDETHFASDKLKEAGNDAYDAFSKYVFDTFGDKDNPMCYKYIRLDENKLKDSKTYQVAVYLRNNIEDDPWDLFKYYDLVPEQRTHEAWDESLNKLLSIIDNKFNIDNALIIIKNSISRYTGINVVTEEDKYGNIDILLKESSSFTESSIQYNRVSGKLKDLPKGFQDYAIETNEDILEDVLAEMQRHKDFDSLDDDDVEELINWMDAKSNEDGYGYFFIEKDKDDKNFAGEMRLFPKTGKQFGYISKKLESIWDKSLKYVFDKKHAAINKKDPTKKLTLVTDENLYTLVFVFSKEYAEKLYNYCINPRRFPLTESTSNEENESYNVDMSESEAKKTLGTLTQSIINDKKPVSQYTANIYANIITKNLLPIWAKGYRKLSITIDDDNKNFTVFEFKIPTMTQDFVARFINGRETVTGLLHRNPEIRIKMSSRLFNTIKDRNDAYNFFKAAIKYYDSQAEKYSMKMMSEVMKLNHEMKHLVSNTKLSALVTYPMTLLFAFDDLDMSSKDCFKIDQSDIAAVNKFVKGIYTNYASPEKEKKQIINDLHSVVKALKESLEMDDNLRNILYLPEAVDTLLNGGFDNEINKVHNQFIHENTDTLWPNSSPDPQVKYLAEKFGVKKLKKIPTDLIAYIQIETESIKDSNDKMMIASYCLSKIEIVEWYIELLEVGSKKYIVPHTKQYLETVRTQLLQCYKEIMAVKIKNPNDRPIIDIKYPKGYEG